jgi:PAS domain S-box-containing protein
MLRPSRRVKGLLLAVAAVVVAALARAVVDPFLPGAVPFITFFPAVAVAAWYGGIWPGLLATLLSYFVSDWFFNPPYYSLDLFAWRPGAFAEFVVFLAMSGVIIGLGEALNRANDRTGKQARHAAQQQKLLEVTLVSIGDGVIATDVDGRVTFINAVAESLTGWTQAEAQGRSLAEVFRIVNEQTRQTVENPCAQVLRTGSIVGLANHTVLIAKDGSERPIDDSAAPISDETGAIHGVVLVFRDGTERRQAFEVVQRLAAIVEFSDDAVIGTNMDGTITSWNAAAERLYGYAAHEAIGNPLTIIVPETFRYELAQVIQRLKSGERIDAWDTVRMRKDGSLVDVSLQISPIRNSYGEVVGASKVARDITQQKREEAALELLAKTSASLAALSDRNSALQQAVGAVVPFFADWCVVYMINSAGQIEYQAYAHHDPQKQPLLRELLEKYPVDWNSSSISVQALRTGETQFVADLSHAQITGMARNEEDLQAIRELSPRSVISVPLRIRERTIGTMSFAASEPSRRYTSRDVKLAGDLAQRVATAIENAELFNAVTTADRQKDEFLAMLAHELRNPLAAIRYTMEAARLSRGNAEDELLEMVERQVNHLARLIDDLLDISRISRGKIQLRRERIDGATIARRAADTVRPLVEEKHHTLVLELSHEPIPLYADATRVEQIIGNLLTNAAKYTPEGGHIQLVAHPENGEAVIKVKDTGIGIAPETLPTVFELFAQADQSLDRAQGGLGVGLTVVRKLAEMHGGTVAAASSGIGQGSEFTVRLPLSRGGAEENRGNGTAPDESSASLRVLVVEDNRDAAQAEAMLLQTQGHEIRVAYDGPTALELAIQFQPHAMLIDIGLPGMNGFEVASRLRAEGFENVLLIAVSGYGQEQDQHRSRAAGFDHHLVKPVDTNALFSLLRGIRPDDLSRSS